MRYILGGALIVVGAALIGLAVHDQVSNAWEVLKS